MARRHTAAGEKQLAIASEPIVNAVAPVPLRDALGGAVSIAASPAVP